MIDELSQKNVIKIARGLAKAAIELDSNGVIRLPEPMKNVNTLAFVIQQSITEFVIEVAQE